MTEGATLLARREMIRYVAHEMKGQEVNLYIKFGIGTLIASFMKIRRGKMMVVESEEREKRKEEEMN